MSRSFRPEPPVIAPGRRPGARAEPPLTAAPRQALAEPVVRPAAPAPDQTPARAAAPPAAARPAPAAGAAAWPEAPAPREALPAAARAEADTVRREGPGAAVFRTTRPRAEDPALAPAAEAPRPARPVAPARAPAKETVLKVRPEAAANSLRRAAARPRDPAPSRLSYRINRLWLTPVYRLLFRVGLPAFAFAFAVGLYLSDEGRREALVGQGTALVQQIQERPEFMVNLMAIEGASPALGEAIRVALPVDFPVSSFDLDLAAMRGEVMALDAVASADLRVRPGGILEVKVVERVPAVLWRASEGLFLLDATGHKVAAIGSRLERPDLPIIAGEGAEAAVPEALALIEAAQPVAARLRGLVRMGERRWDVVLDNGQRILLPEEDALNALERVMALAEAEDMLQRDVTVIDMRYGARPTLRLSPRALDALRGREIETGATNG
jgi:cell division protein FtsQ